MKILLFSRNDLVNLYGALSVELSSHYEFVHLAYSAKEENILREKYNIASIVNFQKEIENIFNNEKLDLRLINNIDEEIIKYTDGRFCLNSSIQSDRTFAYLTYEEVLLMCQVYYKFWDNLIKKEQFKLMLHEPVALFFLHIASIVSKKYKASYLTQINVFGENKYNWIFVSAENGFPVELPFHFNNVHLTKTEGERAIAFLNSFRKEYNLIFPKLATKIDDKGVLEFLIKSSKIILKAGLKRFKKHPKLSDLKTINHVEKYAILHTERAIDKVKNLYDKSFRLKYDEFNDNLNYYYCPMHMEPEAVVLYWGEGYYKNQIKLIENISAQLPPDYYLYVKVHPIVKEEIHFIDISRLKAIPNLKLLGPTIPGKQIISSAKGVMTINGTSGFEGVLLNKPVFVFGNSFYDLSDRVIKINHIKELREKVYAVQGKIYEDDNQLLIFINAYLLSTKTGFTSYYVDYVKRMGIDQKNNIMVVSKGVLDSFNLILSK